MEHMGYGLLKRIRLGFMCFPKKVLWGSAMLFGRNSCQLMFETPCLNIVEDVLVIGD